MTIFKLAGSWSARIIGLLCAAPIPTFALVRKLKVKGRTNDATRRAQAPVTGTGLLVERSHTSARSPRRALTHQETATCIS